MKFLFYRRRKMSSCGAILALNSRQIDLAQNWEPIPKSLKYLMKYKRVLVKVSGESLMGNQNYGIDPEKLDQYALEILETKKTGIELAIVIGGGNIYRGVQAEHAGMPS